MTAVPKGFGFGLAARNCWAIAYSPQGEGGGANDGGLGEWVGLFATPKCGQVDHVLWVVQAACVVQNGGGTCVELQPSRRPKSAASLEGIALKLTAAPFDDGQVFIPKQACSPRLQAAIGGVEHPLH